MRFFKLVHALLIWSYWLKLWHKIEAYLWMSIVLFARSPPFVQPTCHSSKPHLIWSTPSPESHRKTWILTHQRATYANYFSAKLYHSIQYHMNNSQRKKMHKCVCVILSLLTLWGSVDRIGTYEYAFILVFFSLVAMERLCCTWTRKNLQQNKRASLPSITAACNFLPKTKLAGFFSNCRQLYDISRSSSYLSDVLNI